MASIIITGMDDLRQALRRLAREAPAIVSPILAEALEPVARRMASDAPADIGRLARSVRVTEHPVRGGICRSEATARVPYAGHVDLGTKGHPATAFLERAFDAEAEGAAREAEQRITQAIEDTLRR